MKLLLTIILFLFSLQLSYTQDKPDGPHKDYFDTGELKVEGHYKKHKTRW